MSEAIDHIKLHVDRIKREKAHIEPHPDMPGIEMLYKKYEHNNASVRSALMLWERHLDVSTEQALVSLVDALVKQNDDMSLLMLDMVQSSTRPVIIGGSVTGARIITGNNNKVSE